MSLLIAYLTNHIRHYTFQPFINILNKSNKKNQWKLLILTDSNDNDFYAKQLENFNINYEIYNFDSYNNYINKMKFTSQHASLYNYKYIMKCDNDIFIKGDTLDYILDNLYLLDEDKNLLITPVLSSGIPSVEYFIEDFFDEESKKKIYEIFLKTNFYDRDGVSYSLLNKHTINSNKWNKDFFFKGVSDLNHHYMGIHPIRINREAIDFINQYIIENKREFYNSKNKLEIIIDNKSPYFCDSIFCIKNETYKNIIYDNSLYVDAFDEVPINKYCKKHNMNFLFVKNDFCIHMYYNWFPDFINAEIQFVNKFFSNDLTDILYDITNDKKGVEIGGPSPTGITIYKNANIIDNVIFSKNTIWSNHTDEYNYYESKKGKVIINDAVDISNIKNNVYDFCFSSHCLEHIANPLKAIKEWLRIIKDEGYIIIIVPEKSICFDHKRNYSKFSTLLTQYEKNVGEDDLSTLPEILANHDLNLDSVGNFEEFTKRSLDNFNNRCLHHYIYNPELLLEICKFFNCNFIYSVTIGLDIWFIMQK